MSEPDSNDDHIRSRLEDGVLTVTFHRPEKKNAFTHAMYEAATLQLAAAQVDDAVRVVVLTGTEGCFTAGNDIGDFMQHPPTGEDSAVFRFLRALAGLDTPVLAAVDGPAVGIGTTLLLHCDYVVAADRTRFAMPFVNLGLCPEGASTLLLPFVAGHALASELLMFGEPFDAATALRAGLVNRVVPPAELAAVVQERARALAEKPPQSLRLTKRLLREPQRAAVEEALKREGAAFVERLASPEAMEAFAAFMERRKPDFSRLKG